MLEEKLVEVEARLEPAGASLAYLPFAEHERVEPAQHCLVLNEVKQHLLLVCLVKAVEGLLCLEDSRG